MTDTANAERLRAYYLTHKRRKSVVNICNARRNWNGCDYCDVHAGTGLECWKQDARHSCIHCKEVAKGEK